MGKAELPLHAPGTRLDRGYIGQSVPRPNAQRLLQGRGAFIDDLRFPRLAHVAFFRSPHAHARIKKLDFSKARASEGVIGVFDGRDVAEYCTPWVAVLAHLTGIKSPPQHAIAIERACSQGEACAAVVAETRSQAEDAVGLIEAEWEELPVVVDMEDSLQNKITIHKELGDNICFRRELDTGGVESVFKEADAVAEDTFHFGRHTGVCLEGRALLADYNAGEHSLTVYH
ncbi:MAG TPA: molybdopterin cofactor-binding domain-containing protein, partial [Burkholderiales bacterium]